jgi:hypothetical protein
VVAASEKEEHPSYCFYLYNDSTAAAEARKKGKELIGSSTLPHCISSLYFLYGKIMAFLNVLYFIML